MLCGTSTGAKNTASPNVQAWYERQAEEEAKRKELEGETGKYSSLATLSVGWYWGRAADAMM